MSVISLKKQMIDAREDYIQLLKDELLGPGSEFSVPDREHELISVQPTSRYSVGILYPQESYMNQDNDEIFEVKETDFDEEEIVSIYGEKEEIQVNKDSRGHLTNDETANENLDEEIGMSSQYKQSSMGITFNINGDTDIVKGSLTFATYRRATLKDCIIPYYPENKDTYKIPEEMSHKMIYDKEINGIRLLSQIDYKEARSIFEKDTIPENEAKDLKRIVYRFIDLLKNGFVRDPHEIPEFILDFTESEYVECRLSEEVVKYGINITALRTKLNDETYSITVMLVNTKKDSAASSRNCIFQPEFRFSTQNVGYSFSENKKKIDICELDDEEKQLELLYRNKKNYATGLGTSVGWRINNKGEGEIWNDFFPQVEVPSMNFSLPENNGIIAENELSMKYLSDLDNSTQEEKLTSLTNLVNLYRDWVTGLEKETFVLEERYKETAWNNINQCKRAYERMYKGIEILKNNPVAYSAFLLANRAMFMQRIHLIMQSDMSNEKSDRYPDDEEISDRLYNMNYYDENDFNKRWRPFQIAFILMDITSIVEEKSDDREIVDLIWFPTGGGKTEAYLGLTAFTIFYRKLAHPENSGGTSVMMRYTLRLLAAQQFTRAATLICACEFIRKDCYAKRSKYPAYDLGKEPITIGLWIGGTHIPNNNTGDKSAKYYFDKLNQSKKDSIRYDKDRYNKFQVLKCPWCGTKLVKDYNNKKEYGAWGYAFENEKHFYMFCPHEDCEFTEKLPIQIIDEELYDNPPTLLFGTVDKFAMLPWDGRIGSFFATNSENRCPELIIQDELHLISGSLGTMVGLYESAIDALCCQKGVRPKIIASTATIRRAKEQCSSLYNREIVQFPAPGLDAENSFFAKEAEIDLEKGIFGRRYIGIQPSGKTKAMMEIRLFTALLQKIYTMDLPDVIKDKYWTLTAYYNSLKDLGKASNMVDDDIKDFIVRTANRYFEKRRLIVGADELTSRISTTKLNETLDKLEKVEYSKENIDNRIYASNILLATNMISVGIDVARLNVMLMVGQPKLTSEYIQASSRVGRIFPGMVVVQYDATKSRDRSHYEKFKSYHESFYRYVEPTGATPFSKPARERALHAVLTALLRNKANLYDDKSAIFFDKGAFEYQIEEIEKFIVERVKDINSRSENDLEDDSKDILVEMEKFFDDWQDLVDECNGEDGMPLYFGRRFMVKKPSDVERRLLKQFNLNQHDSAKETMTSMRNVDTSVNGSILIWED